MPGMSGKELAEQLRNIRPGLRVIFMSGYSDDAVRDRNVVGPGIAFLQKPFTPARLAAAIRTVLEAGEPEAGSSQAG
jgi:FixJ family two-component response regulator